MREIKGLLPCGLLINWGKLSAIPISARPGSRLSQDRVEHLYDSSKSLSISEELLMGSGLGSVLGRRGLECRWQGSERVGYLHQDPGQNLQEQQWRHRSRPLSPLPGGCRPNGRDGTQRISLLRELAACLPRRQRRNERSGPIVL
jgi:hypothetical protein